MKLRMFELYSCESGAVYFWALSKCWKVFGISEWEEVREYDPRFAIAEMDEEAIAAWKERGSPDSESPMVVFAREIGQGAK